MFSPDHVAAVIDGIAQREALAGCDAVLSGYMGSADIGNAILSAVARVRALNPQALYCCDPVIGDVGRVPVGARDRVVRMALRAAADWQWYGVPPAAALLPVSVGVQPPQPDIARGR